AFAHCGSPRYSPVYSASRPDRKPRGFCCEQNRGRGDGLGCLATVMGELIEIDPARKRRELEPLWRDVVGRKLRDLRHEQGERLVETATRAGISPQYLSEVERG